MKTIDRPMTVFFSYGIQFKNFPLLLKEWIINTGTTKKEFGEIIDQALKNEEGHYLEYKNNELVFTIYDDIYQIVLFWDFDIVPKEVAFDHAFGGSGQTDLVIPEWTEEVKEYILNNLDKCNIDGTYQK